MRSDGVEFDALLRYNEIEMARWRDWLHTQPETVLDVPAGDPAMWMGTARDLIFHIFIVEWVYARVLSGESWENDWQAFDRSTLNGVFAVADEAQPKLRSFAQTATAQQLAQTYHISSRLGQTVQGSGRKFVTHVVFHSARHWAQIAMLMRQHGHKTDWQHDFVLSDAME